MKFGIEGGGSVGIGVGPAIEGLRGGLGLSLPSFVKESPVSGFGVSLRSLGPKLAGPTQPFVKEGPVKGGLEMFKPIVGGLNAADAVLEAQSILAQARPQPKGLQVPEVFQTGLSDINLDPTIEPPAPQAAGLLLMKAPKIAAVREKISWLGKSEDHSPLPIPDIDRRTTAYPKKNQLTAIGPFAKPAAETEEVLATKIGSMVQTESRVSSQTVQAVSTPITQEQLVRVEEVETGEAEEDVKEHEEVDKVRALHVIDEKGLSKRIDHIIDRFVRFLESKRKGNPGALVSFKGSEAISLLSAANKAEIRGEEINMKDPEEKLADETWEATVEELGYLEFTTEEQIQKQVIKTAVKNHPVAVAKNGEAANEENVWKSHKQFKGGSHGHIEFEKRKQLRKQPGQVLVEEDKKEISDEGTIQDHPEAAKALQAA